MAAGSRQGREVLCCFNKDEAGYAAQNNFKVPELIGKR